MTAPDRRGGYQPPARPAAVSGPGAMSQRTDGQPMQQLPDAAYGEQKTFQEAQRGAPMAAVGTDLTASNAPAPVDLSGVTPLSAESQFPNEAVTSGANVGPGPDASVLGLQQQIPMTQKQLANLAPLLPALEILAGSPNATDEFRAFVREVYARS